MPDLRFTEIEHKYIVDAAFDLQRFREVLLGLSPTRTGTIRVRDRYYLTEGGRAQRFLIRHRFDAEIHQLTIKAETIADISGGRKLTEDRLCDRSPLRQRRR